MSTTRKTWHWTRSSSAKNIFALLRWVHVYFSTALFSLLLLFSITGFTLNHASWFESRGDKGTTMLTLPDTLRAQPVADVSVRSLEQFIEQQTTLRNARAIDIDRESGEITLDYPLPAGYAFATVFPDDGVITIEYQQGTLIALLNDLHKGRHTGAAWSWVIDIAAFAITLFSIAGMGILLQMPRFRRHGLLLFAAGTLTPWLLVALCVPGYP